MYLIALRMNAHQTNCWNCIQPAMWLVVHHVLGLCFVDDERALEIQKVSHETQETQPPRIMQQQFKISVRGKVADVWRYLTRTVTPCDLLPWWQISISPYSTQTIT